MKRELDRAMRAPFRSLTDLETVMPIRNCAAQSQQQPDQKDVLAVAFAGTAPPGGATANRPAQAAVHKAPVNSREQTQSER